MRLAPHIWSSGVKIYRDIIIHRDKFEDATATVLEALKSDDDTGFDGADAESRGTII